MDRAKDKVEVTIGGQVFRVSGDESNAHIKEVATKINKYYDEVCEKTPAYKYTKEQVSMTVAINMGNDCVKMEKELDSCIKEITRYEDENMALMERIEELGLEVEELKKQLKKGI